MRNKNTNAEERRCGSDRRSHSIAFGFPFVDGHGHLVTQERRQQDRRKLAGLDKETVHPGKQKNFA